MSKTILITGGAGFIGSHVVRLFVNKYPDYKIVNLDKLTYAGNLENLEDLENSDNYIFKKGDIVDKDYIRELFEKYNNPGILVHGVALKPGKPLCLAILAGTPAAILPGFPTSATFTFSKFIAPVLRAMAGRIPELKSSVLRKI